MQVAQKLYEGVDIGGETVGLITYMRTDGVQMAPEAIAAAAPGDRQPVRRALSSGKAALLFTKAKNAQEAARRPFARRISTARRTRFGASSTATCSDSTISSGSAASRARCICGDRAHHRRDRCRQCRQEGGPQGNRFGHPVSTGFNRSLYRHEGRRRAVG